MVEEDFTKDLEDVEEIEEEKDEKDSDEDLEDILDESEKTTDETINIRTDYLNRFLANPWKTVSLDETGITPMINLEEELPEETKEKKDEEENQIEYELFNEEMVEGKYKSPTRDTDFYDEKLSEGERNLEKQKKLYDSPKKLRNEMNREPKSEMKYVKVENTIKKDYLSKKKFAE
jgi:hypothetical protein